jgi:hypothetical protein
MQHARRRKVIHKYFLVESFIETGNADSWKYVVWKVSINVDQCDVKFQSTLVILFSISYQKCFCQLYAKITFSAFG